MPGRRGWGVEARAVAAASHGSGMGRRMPKYSGVTADAAKNRTRSKLASNLKVRRSR